MENYVITIGRELGSGGKSIGEMMAKELGIPVYDRRLIMMAAQESGLAPEVFEKADETPGKGLMSHILRGLSTPFASFNSLYNNSMSKESLFQVQADIIRQKAAQESCIIVGRCSDYILREHPRHLDIFVRANYEDRVAQLMRRHQCTDKEAKELIERIDEMRSEYHNFYAETNWGDSRAYDICVNSSILGIEGTAELLLSFVRKALNL
jgi:cytidylate kinase